MAESFASLGHHLAGCGRSNYAIERLQSDLGSDHLFASLDVSEDKAVRVWASEVLARFGPPDLLINNAAVINTNATLWKVPAVEFDRVVDINIKGVVNVIRHFLPAMIEQESGVIINVSSEWGRSTSPEVAPYCATKWAIEGLTRSLAQELPRGMAAIPVSPGVIDTDMLRSCFGEAASQYPDPQKWARKAIPFLLSLGPKDNGRPLTIG
jgi:NAD(P)-dependent dehydrogenase (short-subunit alcohol dehydrogenase family)